MARKTKLPNVGDVFSFKLDDGRFGACRVIRAPNKREAAFWGGNVVVVVGSAWIGADSPSIDTQGLSKILHLTHHSHTGHPVILWIGGSPPKGFKLIGNIEPSINDKKLKCNAIGDWDSIQYQPLMQWRWDNELDLVLAEERAQDEADDHDLLAANNDRQSYLASVTLDDLSKRRFLSSWTGFVEAEPMKLARKLLRETVNQLSNLGVRSQRKSRVQVFKDCVVALNDLDRLHRFIETEEREDLCEELEVIAYACRLGDIGNQIDEWRDW